jgi:hypothetical protein
VANHETPQLPPAPSGEALSAGGATRRRFAKAGFVASGVLMTVASQPGMACDICATPSGSLSGGLQSHRGKAPTCSGRMPSYWKATSSWPKGCSKTTKFGSIFSCTGSYAMFANVTLQNILVGQSFDTNGVAMYTAAAYLNVLAGLSSFQTTPMLQNMWKELHAKGYYTPTAGKKWYNYDVANYLSGTMG